MSCKSPRGFKWREELIVRFSLRCTAGTVGFRELGKISSDLLKSELFYADACAIIIFLLNKKKLLSG